jgi:hypothetical protein
MKQYSTVTDNFFLGLIIVFGWHIRGFGLLWLSLLFIPFLVSPYPQKHFTVSNIHPFKLFHYFTYNKMARCFFRNDLKRLLHHLNCFDLFRCASFLTTEHGVQFGTLVFIYENMPKQKIPVTDFKLPIYFLSTF